MVKPHHLSAYSAGSIQKAAEQLKAGHLVAFPTETVYGLGADAINEEAVNRVYEVKGRPSNHPLIVHISKIEVLEIWTQEIPDYAIKLARAYWPGPLTLILKRKEIAKNFITGSQDSVGIRIPANSIALELLSRFESLGGQGIAAPSANRFGHVSPTSLKDVQDEIGKYLSEQDSIIDGGQSEVGIESTIIDCRKEIPAILRPGAITAAMITSTIKVESFNAFDADLRVSGNLERHYAPNAKIIVNQAPKSGQAFYALSNVETPAEVYRISSPRDIIEFARNLYGGMRKADELGFNELVVEIPEGQGIEVALLDRVSKAARGR